MTGPTNTRSSLKPLPGSRRETPTCELCGVLTDGRTAFNLIQNATDTGQGSLIFFLFDLLHLDGENLTALPLVDRKTRLASLLKDAPESLRYNDHQIGHGPAFHRLACDHGLEGIVSKRTNGRYEPDRRTWLKIKCLNPAEFVVVGWSDPEGSRHRIGSCCSAISHQTASSSMQ